jgi:hypothetical protein
MTFRKCPQLRVHRRLNLAYVAFTVDGKRRTFYFGPVGSATARVRYGRFCELWPRQILDPQIYLPSPGRWSEPRLLTFQGRTQSLSRWAKEFGLKPTTLRDRLDVRGWDLHRALTTPVKAMKSFPFQGRQQSLAEWSTETGIPVATLKYRVYIAKWPLERAISTIAHKPERKIA